jgi:O-antigen/teichoic acid export membrane protein
MTPGDIRKPEPAHMPAAVTLSCTLGLSLGGIVYFGAPEISVFYRIPELEPILRAVALLVPLDGLNTVAKSLRTQKLRFRRYIVLADNLAAIGEPTSK